MIQGFGRYKIESELGSGAYGLVYKAFDPTRRIQVAIKVLSHGGDPDSQRRFEAEANTTASLSHENVVRIHEFAQQDGCSYLVMELVHGQTMQQLIEAGNSLSLLEKVEILHQVAAGLQHAHGRGVIHGDIKPGNIMVGPKLAVKVMDFGAAALVGAEATRRAHQNNLLGTILYTAPELFDGQKANVRSDIFALGVLCHEFLTGTHPFRAEDVRTTMFRIKTYQPPRVLTLVEECSVNLDAAIGNLLQKDPELRYESMDDVLLDFEPIVHDLKDRRAEELFAQVPGLITGEEFQRARDVIKQVLDLSPGHAAARQVRDGLKDREYRHAVEIRLQSLRREAERLIQSRLYADAIDLIESAPKRDLSDPDIAALLQRAKSAREKARTVARLISDARWDLRRGDLESALRKASEALAVDDQDAEVAEIAAAIRGEMEVLQSQIEELIRKKQYSQAIAALAQISGEPAASGEVADLLHRIDDEERRERARRELEAEESAAGIRSSIASGDLDGALAMADTALTRLGQDPSLLRCKEEVETAIQQRRLKEERKLQEQQLLADALALIASLESEQCDEEALKAAQQARKQLENCPELEAAADRIRERLQEREKLKSLAKTALNEIEDFIAARDWTSAAAALNDAQPEYLSLIDSEALAARIERGRIEDRLETLRLATTLALSQNDFDAAERALSESRTEFGGESLWGELQREFRLHQLYGTALFMAEKARLGGNPKRAKELLEGVARTAPDGRARELLELIGKDLQAAAKRPAQLDGTKPTNGVQSARKPANNLLPRWLLLVAIASVILLCSVYFVSKRVRPVERPVVPHGRTGAKPKFKPTPPIPVKLEPGESEWKSLDKKDADALRSYIALFPGNPHVPDAKAKLIKLADEDGTQVPSVLLSPLTTYVTAIRQKDEAGLKAVWPGIPEVDLNLWHNAFQKTKTIWIYLEPLGTAKIRGGIARVDCRRKITKTFVNGAPYSNDSVIYILLQKAGDGWVIQSVSAP